MKEYEKKSLEELHWEDYRSGRKGQAAKSHQKTDGEGGNSSKKRESLVEDDGDEKSDKMAEKELASAEARRKVLTPAFSLEGHDSGTPLVESGSDHGVSLKEMESTKVREKDAVAEKKTVGEESGGSSPAVAQIISVRPKLKRKVKK